MSLRGWLGRRTSVTDRVALVVDGPNVLRDEFDVDLSDVRSSATDVGRVGIARLYLDEHASPGLIRAAEAHGFEVIVTSGDVDVKLAIDATQMVLSGRWDVLAVASRDLDFKPLLELAGVHGVSTLTIAPATDGRADGLVRCSDVAVILED